MPSKLSKPFHNLIFYGLLFAVLISLIQAVPGAPPASAAPEAADPIFLPIIRKPPLPTAFGIDMGALNEAKVSIFSQAGSYWIRRGNLDWAEVEPAPGIRNWAALADLELEMIKAAQQGMPLIIIVSRTPAWARLLPNYSCGPIHPSALGAFASFMHDLVARYSRPPYNVMFWELWNEPDASPTVLGEEVGFGCWGDSSDPYYGGRAYGDMLKIVSPLIRAANPDARVVFGGLLLDCDPAVISNCKISKFLEGALSRGAGPYFDAISFHSYDYFNYELGTYNNGNWNSVHNIHGPSIHAKSTFIKNTLAAFGYSNKLLMNTESALICVPEDHPTCISDEDSDFEQTKAYYVAEAYASALAEGLAANIWYNAYGWRDSGLLYPDGSPRPAFEAYTFARTELGDASYVRTINEFGGIFGYEFHRGAYRVWLLRSLDGSPRTISMPGAPLAVYDVYGVETPNPTASLTVTRMPLYVEWPP